MKRKENTEEKRTPIPNLNDSQPIRYHLLFISTTNREGPKETIPVSESMPTVNITIP
jgi:hypothetical protein